MTLRQIIKEEIANYNLQQKYNEFNRLYFDNKLPSVPVTFTTNTRVVGGGAYPKKKVKIQ